MSAHLCTVLQPEGQCYRCDLNRDEVLDQVKDRVREFLEAWDAMYPASDLVYALGFNKEARELLVGDLRTLLEFAKERS